MFGNIDLGNVANLCIAIIMIALAIMLAVCILKAGYDVWMGNGPTKKGDQ